MRRLFFIFIFILAFIFNSFGADPGIGDVVINEIYVGPGDTYEGAEYIELYNTSSITDFDLNNVYIGGTEYDGTCGGEDIWQFPVGATIPANGYVIVVKDVEDGDGFCDIFVGECSSYSYIYEMYDSDRAYEVDSLNVPNMILSANDPANDDQMGYIGGTKGYGKSCGGTYNLYEAYYLRVGGTTGTIIDCISYCDSSCVLGEYCTVSPRTGEDQNPLIVTKSAITGYSIYRSPNGADTDQSADDLVADSNNTPRASNTVECDFSDTTPPDWTPAGVAGLIATDAGTGGTINLTWNAALDADNPSYVKYALYRNTTDGFEPSAGNRIASPVSGTNYTDSSGLIDGTIYYYRIETFNCCETAGATMATDQADATPTSGTGPEYDSICDVQAFDQDGLSPMVGQDVTIRGIVTAPPEVFSTCNPIESKPIHYYIQDSNGCGVDIFDYDMGCPAYNLGDDIELTGEVDEYNGATEIKFPENIVVHSTGNTVPEPCPMNTGGPWEDTEANEGKLVVVHGFVTDSGSSESAGRWFYIDDGTGEIEIYFSTYGNAYEIEISTYQALIGMETQVQVVGILTQYDYSAPYTEYYEIKPRFQSDISIYIPPPAEEAYLAVSDNPFSPDLNETTIITIGVKPGSKVVIRVYDIAGKLAYTMFDDFTINGEINIEWTGRNELMRKLPIGVYILHAQVTTTDSRTFYNVVPLVIATPLK